MAVRCPRCGEEYDVVLFEYGGEIRCECGIVVRLEHHRRIPPPHTKDLNRSHLRPGSHGVEAG